MKANDKQVGGTHYRNNFQHWDLAAELGLGYFEGQITKYLTRHRFKKGKEDAEKALHFTEKLLELAQAGQQPMIDARITEHRMLQYVEANELVPLEMACLMRALDWYVPQDLSNLVQLIQRLIRTYYPEAPPVQMDLTDGSHPGPGYVNQG